MIANLAGADLGLWIIIALIVLVGGSQIPKIARNVGLAGREFKKAQKEAEDENAREKAKQGSETVAPPAELSAPVAPAPTASSAPAGESITMTPGQLDALLRSREEQVRNEARSASADN